MIFSDIKLKDYADASSCVVTGLRRSKFNYDLKEPLFAEYGRHLAEMLNTAHTTQNKLLDVLKVIFKKEKDPITKEEKFTIHPKLTQKILDEQVRKTRKIIVNLYARCEQDFRKGVKLFDAITASKEFDKYTKRKENLKHQHAFVAGQPKVFGSSASSKVPHTQTPAQTLHNKIIAATRAGVLDRARPEQFYKSAQFLGKVSGYVFRRGNLGQGYYKDTTGPAVRRGVAFIPGPPPPPGILGYGYRTGPQGLGYYLDNPQGLVGGPGARRTTIPGSGWGPRQAPVGGRRR